MAEVASIFGLKIEQIKHRLCSKERFHLRVFYCLSALHSNIACSTDNLLHSGKKDEVEGELSKLVCLREVYRLLTDPDSIFFRVFLEIFIWGKSEDTQLQKETSTPTYS